jgi:hypothetical protein
MTDPYARPFAWSVAGESFHEGSSSPWKPEHHEGVFYAENAGEALERIVSGLGEGTTMDNTIPWDLIEQDREITITIRPADDPPSDTEAG